MGLFNRDNFLNAGGSGEGFKEIPSGVYTLEIEQVDIKRTANGAVQLAIGWSIDPDENDEYVGQWLFENQTLLNKDGSQNDIGVNWLGRMFMALSEGTWEPTDFLENEEANANKFVGTRIIGKVKNKPSKNPEFPQPSYNVKVNRVLTNAYNRGEKVSRVVDTPKEEPAPPKESVKLKAGMEIQFKYDGVSQVGIIEHLIEENNLLQVIRKDGSSVGVHLADCEAVVRESVPDGEYIKKIQEEVKEEADIDLEMDDELDETEEPPLQAGCRVSFKLKGEDKLGEVLTVDEDEGKVRIKFMMDGKEKTGAIGIDKVTVVAS